MKSADVRANLALTTRQDQPPTGCKSLSLLLRTLKVTNTTVYGGNPLRGQNTSITFALHNSATGATVSCAAENAALTPNGLASDPYLWYDCSAAEASPSTKSAFQYDAMLSMLSINQTWTCNDKSSEHPYVSSTC